MSDASITMPTDPRHPSWCATDLCTAHLDELAGDRPAWHGYHRSTPHTVGNPRVYGYPTVRVSLALHAQEPIGEPPAIQVELTRGDAPSVEGYELDQGMCRDLAAALLETADAVEPAGNAPTG